MSTVAAPRHPEQRNEHDHTDKRAKRRYMGKYDRPPAGVLTWPADDMSAKRKALRRWRRACWARYREHAIACRIASLLTDYADQSGYAFPGNERLAEECFASHQRVDKTLTRLERDGAILRVYERTDDDIGRRRIYLATAVIVEFESPSKID